MLLEITAMRSDGSELPVELAITVVHSEGASDALGRKLREVLDA